jgi:hypothetical protein
MNLEYRTSHANFANPTFTQAGFTYSMILNLVKIQDTGKGAKSVTNDIENVLRKIEVWHQGSIAGYPDHVPGHGLVGWRRVKWRARQVFRHPGNRRSSSKKEASGAQSRIIAQIAEIRHIDG